jgi:hypothetical protein
VLMRDSVFLAEVFGSDGYIRHWIFRPGVK